MDSNSKLKLWTFSINIHGHESLIGRSVCHQTGFKNDDDMEVLKQGYMNSLNLIKLRASTLLETFKHDSTLNCALETESSESAHIEANKDFQKEIEEIIGLINMMKEKNEIIVRDLLRQNSEYKIIHDDSISELYVMKQHLEMKDIELSYCDSRLQELANENLRLNFQLTNEKRGLKPEDSILKLDLYVKETQTLIFIPSCCQKAERKLKILKELSISNSGRAFRQSFYDSSLNKSQAEVLNCLIANLELELANLKFEKVLQSVKYENEFLNLQTKYLIIKNKSIKRSKIKN